MPPGEGEGPVFRRHVVRMGIRPGNVLRLKISSDEG